jgi:hypothetical protein
MGRLTTAWGMLLVAAVVVTTAVPASGQTVTDTRVWTNLGAQGRTGAGSPYRWSLDSQFRTRDGVDAADQTSVRGLITRDVGSQMSLGAGYGVIVGFPAAGGTSVEHRLFQQVAWIGRAAGNSLALRTRLEQRFLEDDSRVAVRVRQQVRLMRVLTATGRLSLVISDEVTANLRDTARVAQGFDQNRAFAGVRRTVTRRTEVEIGYINQYLRARPAPSRLNHVLSATLVVVVAE